DQEGGAGRQAGQDPGGVARPRPADPGVCRGDKRQRHQQQEQRAACVEEDRGCQSAFDSACERAGGLGGPSPGVLGMMSRIGRIRSIGIGKTMVVFFSYPISTSVWRKRNWRAPCWEEMTWAALA